MITNPYQAPGSEIADLLPTGTLPMHTRPLWSGVLGSASAPVVLMTLFSAWPLLQGPVDMLSLLGILMVATFALVIGLVITVMFGLPVVLLLRRAGHLRAAWVCLAASLVGAAVGLGLFALDPGWDRDVEASSDAFRGVCVGAAFGLASGLGMVLGAGIRFRRK